MLSEPFMADAIDILDYPNGELVIGLVAAVGTDLELFERLLAKHLKKFKYEHDPIRLSRFLKAIDPESIGMAELRESPEKDRLNDYMDAGDKLRHMTGRNDILALSAVSAISQSRSDQHPALFRRAHVLRSLKHPDEVHTLRRIYGDGFYLIGIYSSEDDRLRFLVENKNVKPEENARELIKRDQEEAVSYGQRTRDAFQLADVFISLQKNPEKDLCRFLDLLFGNPYVSPTPDEQAMFSAFSSSLRSASLSRQVGAVVTSETGEVIAVGTNDVPAFGGGLYWPGPGDQRDHVRGFDSNDRQTDEIILDVMKRLRPSGSSEEALLSQGKKLLKGSPLYDLTEYGRAVHAEMEALLSCARSGVSPRGGTLYSTTFPCHNCAKHIVAAGVKRVVYVEPYPKSKAADLHGDSLSVEEEDSGKVLFEPFVGVAARRYFDLFSLKLGSGYRLERKAEGKVVEWDCASARLRVAMLPTSYIDRERLATKLIAQAFTKPTEDQR